MYCVVAAGDHVSRRPDGGTHVSCGTHPERRVAIDIECRPNGDLAVACVSVRNVGVLGYRIDAAQRVLGFGLSGAVPYVLCPVVCPVSEIT